MSGDNSKAVRLAGIQLYMECPHCAQPVMLNGPIQNLSCSYCLNDIHLSPGIWANLLVDIEDLFESTVEVNQTYLSDSVGHEGYDFDLTVSREGPVCTECGKPLPEGPPGPGEDHPRQRTVITCPSCQTEISESPIPNWLSDLVSSATILIGAELAPAVPDSTVKYRPVDDAEQKPVIMACPQCGAGLSCTIASERIFRCDHCGADVYLPDAVWARLHPVKTMTRWYVRYEGPTTRERWEREEKIRRYKAERKQREKEAVKRRAETVQMQREEAKKNEEIRLNYKKRVKSRRRIAWVFAMIACAAWICLLGHFIYSRFAFAAAETVSSGPGTATILLGVLAAPFNAIGNTLRNVIIGIISLVAAVVIPAYNSAANGKENPEDLGNTMVYIVSSFPVFGLILIILYARLFRRDLRDIKGIRKIASKMRTSHKIVRRNIIRSLIPYYITTGLVTASIYTVVCTWVFHR